MTPSFPVPDDRMACRDCGLIQRVPRIAAAHVVECVRCGRVLATRTVGRVHRPLALALSALFLLVPAAMSPLLSVSTMGAVRQNSLTTGVRAFASEGFPELGTLVLVCGAILPFV